MRLRDRLAAIRETRIHRVEYVPCCAVQTVTTANCCWPMRSWSMLSGGVNCRQRARYVVTASRLGCLGTEQTNLFVLQLSTGGISFTTRHVGANSHSSRFLQSFNNGLEYTAKSSLPTVSIPPPWQQFQVRLELHQTP